MTQKSSVCIQLRRISYCSIAEIHTLDQYLHIVAIVIFVIIFYSLT